MHTPEALAEALRAWRGADHSRALIAHADGSVQLVDLSGGRSRRFASFVSASAAVAAIESGQIRWSTQRVEIGKWGRQAFAS